MKQLFAVTTATFLLATQGLFASLDTIETVVKKARAHLGEEAKLQAVQSIQYRGKVVLHQEENLEGEAILTFQKPDSQRIEFRFPDRVLVSGFDGFEGYEFLEWEVEGVRQNQTRSLGGDELRRNKAAAIENLNFFRPFSFNRENVIDRGRVMVDAKNTHRIDFIHNGRFVFSRFFDLQTGDLVRSELETGMVTIESGDITVDGIRFSTKVRGELNGELQFELSFEQIEVNPDLPSSHFDFPR
jgi:hypothetical protein